MSFLKLTIRDVPLDHQTVLVRTDYNVPLTPDGKISDDSCIRASLPTLHYLLDRGCKLVIISHLGCPKGRDAAFSLEPVALRLAQLLKKDVRFVSETIGDKAYQAIKCAPKISVTVLENLCYYPEEESDDYEFAQKLARTTGARYFIQDGFGVVNRAYASTHAITLCVPSVAGLLLEREYTTITKMLELPKRPFVAVLGGNKVGDRTAVIKSLIKIADKIIIGGALANTFLAYRGFAVGASKVEENQKSTLDGIYAAARKKVGKRVDDFIIIPVDLAVATSLYPENERRIVKVGNLERDDNAFDIGDASIERVGKEIKKAHTVVWNGLLGYSGIPAFAYGSACLALAIAINPEVDSIISGGDTADFVLKFAGKNREEWFSHISTDGGTSLKLIAGNKLPGIESLLDSHL